jgi:hypothetical protein
MGGLEVIDDRFTPIYERATAVLGADDRVAEVRLAGSVAAGTADRWSDLDLYVIAHGDDYDELVADWPTWLDAITPTVFARTPIAPFVINTVTTDGLTVDLSVWKDEVPAFTAPAGYSVGMLSGMRFSSVDDALEYAVAEQLRGMAGPFISLIEREEHLRHLTGVSHLVGLLTTVFVAELEAPAPAKHWNETFTVEQRAAVAALPPVAATRDALIDFGLALARLVVTRARPLFVERGIEWPTALATVVADRVDECLGVDTRAWLH